MACYTFDGQHFHPCEPRVPWPDGMVQSEWLKLSGFEPSLRDGDDDDLEVYANQGETAFVALVAPFSDIGHVVYIDEFSALMAFIRDHARPAALVRLAEEVLRLGDLADKAFRTWHGHGPDEVCAICDPDTYRRWQELRGRRRGKA